MSGELLDLVDENQGLARRETVGSHDRDAGDKVTDVAGLSEGAPCDGVFEQVDFERSSIAGTAELAQGAALSDLPGAGHEKGLALRLRAPGLEAAGDLASEHGVPPMWRCDQSCWVGIIRAWGIFIGQ